MPSTFEMNSMPMAALKFSACRSVFIVNRMTAVCGIAFFKIVAASAPFNQGIARPRSIESGFDFFAVNGLANYEFSTPALQRHSDRQTHRSAVIGNEDSF